MSNAPDPLDACVLGEGEKKLVFKKDDRVTNAGTFIVNKEDHTLGNLLRKELLLRDDVLFAGYAHYHPLRNAIELRIQTKPDTLTPGGALVESIRSLSQQSTHIADTFAAELERFKGEMEEEGEDGTSK